MRRRNIVLVLLGIVVLVAKSQFAAPLSEMAYSYLGNLSVSFATYYLFSLAAHDRWTRLAIALVGLGVVEGFELADGFGVMANVYDPLDYLANALGILLALLVDLLSERLLVPQSEGS